ncbi:MAG: thiamine phosphate synthase [Phycisphaerales bacterium]|nr:thiamine phosphate synthase [Phycisphaerales bacterium]
MNDLYRIIDANTNRASEGIRVLEDIARFSLNSEDLSRRLKFIRHQFRTALDQLQIPQSSLLANRDTSNDVGTSITTSSESDRSNGITDLVTAASKRSQEAVRVLEESAKALNKDGRTFESIRYELYDLQRDIIIQLSRPAIDWSVCVLLTKSLCIHHTPERILRDIARAGAQCVQIREKDLEADAFYEHALEMTTLARELGLTIIINDRTDIALAVDADGVHLGQSDLPTHAARELLGPSKLIGRSCATTNQLHEAFDQGADYCGLGPVYPSTTKAKPLLSGLETLSQAMDDPLLRTKQMLAISGIDQSNIEPIASMGFPGVAVSSAICSATDPYESCKAIVESMGSRIGCS